jgi:hypothetical protein
VTRLLVVSVPGIPRTIVVGARMPVDIKTPSERNEQNNNNTNNKYANGNNVNN